MLNKTFTDTYLVQNEIRKL